MRIIICLDDKGGISFGGRRLSRDRELISYLCARYGRMCVSPYSAQLFEGMDAVISPDPAHSECDTCFVEDTEPYLDSPDAEELVVCRWNRIYPSDRRIAIPPHWRAVEEDELTGSSHDRITVSVYRKENDR